MSNIFNNIIEKIRLKIDFMILDKEREKVGREFDPNNKPKYKIKEKEEDNGNV